MPLHKVLHIIFPLVLIIPFAETKVRMVQVSAVVFCLGFIKEVYDWLWFKDPMAIFLWDISANALGIGLAIIIVYFKSWFYIRWGGFYATSKPKK